MRWRQVDQPKGGDDERPDLEVVLSHYGVETHGRGTGMTHCPLHEDNTPSFSFNLDKGLWRCHSCGEGGDSYALIMKKEEVDFVRARALAAQYGFATGSAGRSGEQLHSGSFGRASRGAVSAQQGDRPGRGAYRPSWRRD